MTTKIQIKNVSKSFSNLKVLKNINLNISDGERICIVGPSGSGKTTLLRCISGLESYDEGEILINNLQITSKHKKIGMVFQQYNLFNNKNVMDNILISPICNKIINKKESMEFACDMLSKVDMKDKLLSYPHQLSGGQKQRVAIARALAVNPEILLFDEPTSALDPDSKEKIIDIINSLNKTGITVIIVTHEMSLVPNVSDRVVFMNQGKIAEIEKTEFFFTNPKTGNIFIFKNNYREALTI